MNKQKILEKHLGTDVKFLSPISLELIYNAMEEYAELYEKELIDNSFKIIKRTVRDKNYNPTNDSNSKIPSSHLCR